MDLKRLKTFVHVARTLNFSEAARRIHRTQSSVTEQIQALEADLGVALFDRSNRKLALTAAGSCLLYTGKVYHGGGENRSGTTRVGLNITYDVAWLRQEETQYLSVPREVAAELPERVQRLMGYSMGGYALGYIDDVRDPIAALRPDQADTRSTFAPR